MDIYETRVWSGIRFTNRLKRGFAVLCKREDTRLKMVEAADVEYIRINNALRSGKTPKGYEWVKGKNMEEIWAVIMNS